MSHLKFTINSMLTGCLTWFLLRIMTPLLTTTSLSLSVFQNKLFQLPIIFNLLQLILASALGGIIGYFLFLISQKSPQIPFDQQKIASSLNNDSPEESASNLPLPEQPINKNPMESPITPLKPEEAALHNEKTELKEAFEEKISNGSFEDPNVVVENPGQTLVENPATLFNKAPLEEIKQTDLDDENYSKRRYEWGVPKPGPYVPPPPPPPQLKKNAMALKSSF